jgi:class 3 adenylate cyclase
LPADAHLAMWASALNDDGHWAYVLDAALGDEVNETARIEACATGGSALASKSLVERLNGSDAKALGIDVAHTTYTPLADLPTATEKARRDAPSIAVCEI